MNRYTGINYSSSRGFSHGLLAVLFLFLVSTAGFAWVSLGIGVAAGAGAAVTGSLALSKEKDVRSKCTGITCPESTADDIQAIQTLGPLTDVLIGVAAAGIVTGIVLFFVEGGDESSTAVALAPLPAGGGALIVGGSF